MRYYFVTFAALLIFFNSIAHSDVPIDDLYEPNDIADDAYDLTNHENTWLSDVSGIGRQFDDDWFKITVPTLARVISVELLYTAADGDIDLKLFKSTSETVASSTTSDDNDEFDYHLEDSRDYLIKVESGLSIANSENDYNLRWKIIGMDDSYEPNDTLQTAYDLSAHEGRWLNEISGRGTQYNEDWFKITIPANCDYINVKMLYSASEGDPDLRLYEAVDKSVASSTTSDDNDEFDYRPEPLKEYWIQVYYDDWGISYDLKWEVIPKPSNVPAMMLLL